jgi:hypothetical protein
LLDGGGERWPLVPNLPKGSPPLVKFVRFIGPQRGHIGIVLSLPAGKTPQLARAFDELGEYRAIPAQDGRALVLIDPNMPPVDERLALACAAGRSG